MKVYTRTGDEGETSLFNGARVPKNHALIDAYGTVDECNAAIGLANSHLMMHAQLNDEHLNSAKRRLQASLETIQHYLFDLGAHLATPRSTSSASKINKTKFPEMAAPQLEKWIDEMDGGLDRLTTFILPGGHPAAAALHLARTIARRAERIVTPLYRQGDNEIDETAYRFINRLSDYLFVASRYANRIVGVSDVTWNKGAGSEGT